MITLQKAIVANAYNKFRTAELEKWQQKQITRLLHEAIAEKKRELLTKKIHPCQSLFIYE